MTEQGNVQPWRELMELIEKTLISRTPTALERREYPPLAATTALTTQIEKLEHDAIDVEADRRYQQDRARAAEQRVEELERERDDWKAIAEDSTLEAGKLIVKWKARAEKAERALAEMRKALGAYRGALLSGERETPKLAALADAALAASTEEPR